MADLFSIFEQITHENGQINPEQFATWMNETDITTLLSALEMMIERYDLKMSAATLKEINAVVYDRFHLAARTREKEKLILKVKQFNASMIQRLYINKVEFSNHYSILMDGLYADIGLQAISCIYSCLSKELYQVASWQETIPSCASYKSLVTAIGQRIDDYVADAGELEHVQHTKDLASHLKDSIEMECCAPLISYQQVVEHVVEAHLYTYAQLHRLESAEDTHHFQLFTSCYQDIVNLMTNYAMLNDNFKPLPR